MARRISSSQLKNQLRQIENKQRQAIQKYNQEVRRHNQKVKTAVDNYNREVRAYNARVQRNRQQIKNALTRLQRTPVTHQTHIVFRTSTYTLNSAYDRLEQQNYYDEDDPRYLLRMVLPQQENANSLAVANAILSAEVDEDEGSDLQSTSITDELSRISSDLHSRWHGALFSLSPRNPDATRHFCTSVREIFTQILHIKAPDDSIFAMLPNCEKDQKGKPTRRSRIKFLLHQKSMSDPEFEDFIDKDIDNVIDLFSVFNSGTHGEAGKFDLHELLSVKRRVEDAIIFVTSIAS